MTRAIDRVLDGVTMYRLVFQGLVLLALVAAGLSAAGRLPFTPLQLAGSAAALLASSWLSNQLVARAVRAPVNGESAWITGLILLLILPPATTLREAAILAAAAAIASASKYALAVRRQHLLNPAAVAALVVGLAWPGSMATWWVGSADMILPTLLLGIVVLRRLGRTGFAATFVVVSTVATVVVGARSAAAITVSTITDSLRLTLLSMPVLFFAAIMLTEPLTTPPRRWMRSAYAVLVGLLFAIPFQLGPLYSSPELALVIGNLATFLVHPRWRMRLQLVERTQLTRSTQQLRFSVRGARSRFSPGQYLEWTLVHPRADTRGQRRTFTIASAPEQDGLAIGVKFPEPPSSFKRALADLPVGGSIVAAQVAGDFTLPRDPRRKLLLIAGGIGVTPFQSMLQHLATTHQRRDAVLLYLGSGPEDFAYREQLEAAAKATGIRMVCIIPQPERAPAGWAGAVGRPSPSLLLELVRDLATRTAYISGPSGMVRSIASALRAAGLPRRRIVTDAFSGY